MHNYLHDPLLQKALEFLTSISLGQKEIYDMLHEQNTLQQRVDELGRKVSQLIAMERSQHSKNSLMRHRTILMN